MKKIILLMLIIIALFATTVNASETLDETTKIPEMNLEHLIQTMKAKQAKVDIIKKK